MSVTEAFYEASTLQEPWENALELASQAWLADGVMISTYPECIGGLFCSPGLDDLRAKFLAEKWYKHDIRTTRSIPLLRKGGGIVTDFDLFTADELQRLPFYSDFLKPLELGWFAGTILGETGGALITLSLHRRKGKDPFSRDELAVLRRDLPHLRRAARLASHNRMIYAESLSESLGRFASGAILIDRLGRVLRVSEKAEAYLGQSLQITSSRLKSPYRERNKALQELIASATRPILEGTDSGPASILLHRPHHLPLIVSSHPIVRQASDVFQGARALLLIDDPSEDRPLAKAILEQAFQLTPAELRIASALLKGLDTQQIANEHGIGTQTVRYHLKSIFLKTDTSHQAQLVSLLARFTGRF